VCREPSPHPDCSQRLDEALISSACCMCRQDAFTLDVLEVTQGSGSGFVWDKSGHIVTNFHVIRGASDLRLVGTTECFMLSYYTFLVVWLCSNRSLSILVLMVRVVGVSLKYGLAFQ
jgi:hypothetical protein